MTTILSLPDQILDRILVYATYDEVSRIRLVCKSFDSAAQRVLNEGFYKVEELHVNCLKSIKQQLPRRESERRKHALSAHCDILTAVETRLSLLKMTFMKYVDSKYCCFIPGKVLDEILKILRYVMGKPVSPRAHETLQELRDISSMAMEYFDEKIAPTLRRRRNGTLNQFMADEPVSGSFVYCSSVPSSSSIQISAPYAKDFVEASNEYRKLHSQCIDIQKDCLDSRKKLLGYRKKLNSMERICVERNTVISEQQRQILDQDVKIAEFSRKFVEFDKHLSDILLDLKEECQCGVVNTKSSDSSSSKTATTSKYKEGATKMVHHKGKGKSSISNTHASSSKSKTSAASSKITKSAEADVKTSSACGSAAQKRKNTSSAASKKKRVRAMKSKSP